MIRWVLILFLISVIAGALGFSGVAHAASETAKIICYIFGGLFVIALVLLMLGK